MGPAAFVDFWTITGEALDYAMEALDVRVRISLTLISRFWVRVPGTSLENRVQVSSGWLFYSPDLTGLVGSSPARRLDGQVWLAAISALQVVGRFVPIADV
jgi:hypothetical protein